MGLGGGGGGGRQKNWLKGGPGEKNEGKSGWSAEKKQFKIG